MQELQYSRLVADILNQKHWLKATVAGPLAQLRTSCNNREAARGPESGRQGGAALLPFGGLAVDEGVFGWAVAVAMSRSFGLKRCAFGSCGLAGLDLLALWSCESSSCEACPVGCAWVETWMRPRAVCAEVSMRASYGSCDGPDPVMQDPCS